MLAFRDYLLICMLFTAVSIGAYYGAEWFQGRQPAGETLATAPREVPVPDAVSRPVEAPRHEIPDFVREEFAQACVRGLQDDPLATRAVAGHEAVFCGCLADWFLEQMASGGLSREDVAHMAEHKEMPTAVKRQEYQDMVMRCARL